MFDDIIMSENARRSLDNFFDNGKLPHAFIVEGTTEENRMRCALLIAAAFECEGETVPCGECRHCRKISLGVHPDVIVCDRESGKATLGVETVRQMKSGAYVSTNEAEYKVFIFREAQNMTVQSQNALLKIFEEPPKHVKIIMTCDSKASLLDTILSRGTVITLGEAGTGADSQSAEAERIAGELCISLCDENELDFMKKTAVFEKDKKLLLPVAESMAAFFVSAASLKCGANSVAVADRSIPEKLSRRFSLGQLMRFSQAAGEIRDAVKYNANNNLTLTRLSSLTAKVKNER